MSSGTHKDYVLTCPVSSCLAPRINTWGPPSPSGTPDFACDSCTLCPPVDLASRSALSLAGHHISSLNCCQKLSSLTCIDVKAFACGGLCIVYQPVTGAALGSGLGTGQLPFSAACELWTASAMSSLVQIRLAAGPVFCEIALLLTHFFCHCAASFTKLFET